LRHDVAVIDVTPYRSWIYEGWSVNINVTITNQGNFTETVTVDLYYNITAGDKIGTKTVDLSPSETKTLTFSWNTTGVKLCHNYTITAVATIAIESDMTDNTLNNAYIKVRVFGDINGDGVTHGSDMIITARAFGSYLGHPRWNEEVDLNKDGVVDGQTSS
jgi:hypothetical protein